jgi:UDPglucose 6-dehydrogenase
MVRQGIGTDDRIGSAFLFPGPGYGGSCFPKDVKALIRTMHDEGLEADLLEAIEAVNERQKLVLPARVRALLGDDLAGKAVAVWGLAFKAETDDMRESPALSLIERLLAEGASVAAHDPQAMATARHVFGDRVSYAADPYAALDGADALVIVTEWLVFRNPDFAQIKQQLRHPVIVDGRNLFEPARMRALGFRYFAIGRGERA